MSRREYCVHLASLLSAGAGSPAGVVETQEGTRRQPVATLVPGRDACRPQHCHGRDACRPQHCQGSALLNQHGMGRLSQVSADAAKCAWTNIQCRPCTILMHLPAGALLACSRHLVQHCLTINGLHMPLSAKLGCAGSLIGAGLSLAVGQGCQGMALYSCAAGSWCSFAQKAVTRRFISYLDCQHGAVQDDGRVPFHDAEGTAESPGGLSAALEGGSREWHQQQQCGRHPRAAAAYPAARSRV